MLEELEEVRVLSVQPGDTIVVKTKHRVSRESAQRISDALNDKYPTNPVIICDLGSDIEVLRKDVP